MESADESESQPEPEKRRKVSPDTASEVSEARVVEKTMLPVTSGVVTTSTMNTAVPSSFENLKEPQTTGTGSSQWKLISITAISGITSTAQGTTKGRIREREEL